jgi:hypothetical protein
MFERKPRYLIDQHGELRRIYHRQGHFFPDFMRSLRPDKPNLSAVEINGKWVLVEVDGNDQKKATELSQAAHRRQSLLLKSLLAGLFAFIAWNGPFGYRWIWPVKAWLSAAVAGFDPPAWVLRPADGLIVLLLVFVCVLLALRASGFALSALKFLGLEILYRLRFPFMKGAHADLLPVVPRKASARLDLPWKAGFEHPLDAARLMAAGGAALPHGPVIAPKNRRLTGS